MEKELGFDEVVEGVEDIIKRASRKKEEWQTKKDRREGKPLEYRVNIISMGSVGLEVAKLLSGTENIFLSRDISQINLFHRITKQLGQGDYSEADIGQDLDISIKDKTRILEFLLQQMNIEKREKIKGIPYQRLSELNSELASYLDGNPVSDITIVCPRYDFGSDLDISLNALNEKRKDYSRAKSEELKKGLRSEINKILRLRGSIISSFYDSPATEEALLDRAEYIKEINRTIGQIADESVNETGISEKRIRNIRENFLGIAELAKYLRSINYQGLVVMVSNPLDLMANIFCRHFGLEKAHRVIGACDNDRTRLINSALNALQGEFPQYEFKNAEVPVIGTHDEFQVGVSKESKFFGMDKRSGRKIDGVNFYELGGKEKMWLEICRYPAEKFPHDEFEALGTTAHDTGPAIVRTIESVIRGEGGKAVRASVFDDAGDEILWLGKETKFRLSKAYQAKDLGEYDLTDSEREKLNRGLAVQAAVLKKLAGHGLIPLKGEVEKARRPIIQMPVPAPVIERPSLEAILYVASGNFIVEIDANTLQIIKEHEFDHSIRSIFISDDSIYAGYKNGVLRKTRDCEKIIDYRITKTGIDGREFASNSIAVLDDGVYISHSKFGVVRWPLDRPDKPEYIEKNPSHSIAAFDGQLHYLSGFLDKKGYPHFTKICANEGITTADEYLRDMTAVNGSIYCCGEDGGVYAADKRLRKILGLHEDLFAVKPFNNLLALGHDSGIAIINPFTKDVINSYTCNDKVTAIAPANDFVFIATGREGSKNYSIVKWNVEDQRSESIRLGHTIGGIAIREF